MPFTTDAFFAVFGQYNTAIWPLPVAAYVAGLFALVLLRRPNRLSAILVAFILAAMWLVNGIGYHWLFFAPINPLAHVFAAMFTAQAMLLLGAPFAFRDLRFSPGRDLRSLAGLVMVIFAALLYPLWGWLAGHAWPQTPMFGVAPCPTTIFTVGVLLLGPWHAVRWLLVVPALWTVIGGSAAILLNVPQDFGLIATLIVLMSFTVGHWRGDSFALRTAAHDDRS